MAERFAASLAILAFITVVISGILQQESVSTVLLDAVAALLIFYVVGKICALSARKVIVEWLERQTADETSPPDEGEPGRDEQEETKQPAQEESGQTQESST